MRAGKAVKNYIEISTHEPTPYNRPKRWDVENGVHVSLRESTICHT